MDTVMQDLRYAFRSLRRMRGSAAVAVLTLALGIGGTTTVFSVVYAALLRPLPFAEIPRTRRAWSGTTYPPIISARWEST